MNCLLLLIVHKTLLEFFVDFSKAFDVIDHNVLLNKFISNNIPEHVIVWSLDFLNGCKQFVKIGNSVSNTTVVGAGTPQGTVSGPDDFKLVINDLTFNTCYHCSSLLDKHARVITKFSSHKSKSNPCFTSTLCAFKSTVRHAENIWKRTHSALDSSAFKSLRNRYHNLILASKKQYYANLVSSCDNP